MSEPQTPPGPWKLLLGSRKFVVAVLTVGASLAAMAGTHFGLAWDVDKMVAAATPIVLSGLTLIASIGYEDGQAKSAGSGTTTTTVASPSAVSTTIVDTPK